MIRISSEMRQKKNKSLFFEMIRISSVMRQKKNKSLFFDMITNASLATVRKLWQVKIRAAGDHFPSKHSLHVIFFFTSPVSRMQLVHPCTPQVSHSRNWSTGTICIQWGHSTYSVGPPV